MADPTTCLQCRKLSPEREGDSSSGGGGGQNKLLRFRGAPENDLVFTTVEYILGEISDSSLESNQKYKHY